MGVPRAGPRFLHPKRSSLGRRRSWLVVVFYPRRKGSNGPWLVETREFEVETTTEQRPPGQVSKRIERMAATAIVYLNIIATWVVGDEPTKKERLTWTSPRFRAQKRVRRGMWSGQGFNKRKLGTSTWFRTAATVCLIASTAGQTQQTTRFDSDSVTIHVDNCASRCITNSLQDFVKPPQKVIGRVKGMGGDKVAVTAVGTVRWRIDDEEGISHSFLIPGSLYIPESPARLFSPQHWAQERKDNVPLKNGTWQATFADHVLLVWGQQKYRKIIKFDKSNVATFSTTPGGKEFRIFHACLEAGQEVEEKEEGLQDVVAFDATLIVDDEADNDATEPSQNISEDNESIIPIRQEDNQSGNTTSDSDDDAGYTKTTGHHDTSCDKYRNLAVVEDVESGAFEGRLKPTAEVLLWHYRLGHIPFSRIQTMAKEGLLPRRLSDCRLPKCSACIYFF